MVLYKSRLMSVSSSLKVPFSGRAKLVKREFHIRQKKQTMFGSQTRKSELTRIGWANCRVGTGGRLRVCVVWSGQKTVVKRRCTGLKVKRVVINYIVLYWIGTMYFGRFDDRNFEGQDAIERARVCDT